MMKLLLLLCSLLFWFRTAKKNEVQLDEKRRQFSQVLARIINQKKGPIYLDESR